MQTEIATNTFRNRGRGASYGRISLNAKKIAMAFLYVIKHIVRLMYDVYREISNSIFNVHQHSVQIRIKNSNI